MSYVNVNGNRFNLLSFTVNDDRANFVIGNEYEYNVVREVFYTNAGDIEVEPEGLILKDYTRLNRFVDYVDNYEVVVDKVFNDSEAIKVLTGFHASEGEAKELRATLEAASASIPDEEAIDGGIWMFPKWKANVNYAVGDRVQYEGNLYKCIQTHTSQVDWTPDVAVSLFVNVADPTEEWPEWVQPTGAHDAYNAGDKVSHNGSHWISNVSANVWQPGVYGWTIAE